MAQALCTIVFTSVVLIADATEIVFSGSGGCDDQDKYCEDPPNNDEATLWTYILNDDGGLKKEGQLNVGGIPAWMVATQTQNGQKCLFVMLANRSTILSFRRTSSGLTQVGKAIDSRGAAPVHGSISSDGNTLLVANYHGPDDSCVSTGANAAAFSIADNCALNFADAKPHSGSSIIKSRQCGAHVHSFTAGRNNLGFACDLGMDVIFTYKVGADSMLTEVSRTAVEPGQGPRHSVMHPTKDILYVVSEMGSSLFVYRVSFAGNLTLEMTTSTLPAKELKEGYGSKAAELVISDDGKYLYASNRAFADNFQSTVAVFEVSENGLSVKVKQQMVTAPFPRGMTFSKDGSFLIVESQTTGSVDTYKVGAGGLLSPASSAKGPPGAASLMVVPAPSETHFLL